MKKTAGTLLLVWFVTVCLLLGCSRPNTIKFEPAEANTEGFHEINAAEKVDGGVLFYDGEKLIYEKEGKRKELADYVTSLWREDDSIYYISDEVLYTYDMKTKKEQKMVEKPHRILGKYKDQIISYSGRNIYAIQGTKKKKIFKDGYYLNRALLYGNKVYGIPAKNVYAYDLDTLEVSKVTKKKHDMARFFMAGDDLCIMMGYYKNKQMEIEKYEYYKVTDTGMKRIFTVMGNSYTDAAAIVKDGFFVTKTIEDYERKGNRLFYVSEGKNRTIDEDYYYNLIGIYGQKLLYYKSTSYFYEDTLKTFYLYDGIKSVKAFDLNVKFCEGMSGYEYEDGILIEVVYESKTYLYKYDGKTVKEVKLPEYIYRINYLDIIDGKAYINYSDGEESFERLGMIVEL